MLQKAVGLHSFSFIAAAGEKERMKHTSKYSVWTIALHYKRHCKAIFSGAVCVKVNKNHILSFKVSTFWIVPAYVG